MKIKKKIVFITKNFLLNVWQLNGKFIISEKIIWNNDFIYFTIQKIEEDILNYQFKFIFILFFSRWDVKSKSIRISFRIIERMIQKKTEAFLTPKIKFYFGRKFYWGYRFLSVCIWFNDKLYLIFQVKNISNIIIKLKFRI